MKRQHSANGSHSSSLIVAESQKQKSQNISEDVQELSSFPKGVASFFFPDREALKEAVNLWCYQSTRDQAEAQYGHISTWDTSQVTDMREMFKNRREFNDDISGWDVSHVTDMRGMFERATFFNQPIGSWDVSKVIDMNNMFQYATSFNQSICAWNVRNVTDMGGIFFDARSFNQSIGQWDVGNVKGMYSMFDGASSFNQPIGNWDTSKVQSMSFMFEGAKSFNQFIGSWDTSNALLCKDVCRGAGCPSGSGAEQWNLGLPTNGLSSYHLYSSVSDSLGYVYIVRDYIAWGCSGYDGSALLF